ncbi:MAG TPA: VCBS repeat-containing protein [Phycisphaerae bacterium]|nr:VCBS repeat-containing protein [Phycisphaerae bacterium]
MYALRTAITFFVLIVSFTPFAPTLADNCLPYPYYPPTIQVGAFDSVSAYIDVDRDGTPDIISGDGVFAYALDNHGRLTPVRLLDTSMWVLESFPGYASLDQDLDMVSIAKSGEYDYYAVYFRSNGPDERLLQDIHYLGDKDHVGGYVAQLTFDHLSPTSGQLVYLVNESGTCTIHSRIVADGGFIRVTQPRLLNFEAYSPKLADLNNDGQLDLLMQNANGEVVTILRSGLTIANEIDATFPVDYYSSVRFIDYDEDRIPELTFACGQFVRIFKRNNGGYFEWRTFEHDRDLRIIGHGDVDDDGDIDLIIDDRSCIGASVLSGCAKILRQTSLATFNVDSTIQTGDRPTGAAVIDLNADGRSDIAVFNGAGATLHFADGLGGYPQPQSLELNQDEIESPGVLTTIDVNRDGLDDILVSQAQGGGTFVVENIGEGRFSQPDTQTTYGPKVVRIADVDEDGFDDAVCVVDTSATRVVIGYGAEDGALGPFETEPLWESQNATDLDVGDFNGDGHLDIAYTHSTIDRLTILLGNGDRTFRPPVAFDTADGPNNVRVADINNDGLDDVVTANYFSRSCSVFLASQPETLVFHQNISMQFGNGVLADIEIADFDEDGFVDLLAPSVWSGPEIRWGAVDATFTTPDELNAPSGIDALHVTDLNHDGRADIVCYSDDDKTISAYINLGNRAFADPVLFAVPSTIHGLCIGDFDGLGDMDFAINDGSGIYLYFADSCELESAVPGDTNADGLLTPDDVPGFVAILLDLGGSPGARKAADMNQDSLNDATDITMFVACLLSGGCE